MWRRGRASLRPTPLRLSGTPPVSQMSLQDRVKRAVERDGLIPPGSRVLAAVSGGAAGPGRFQQVGPDALAVGLAAAIEFAVAIGIGLVASGRLPRRR